MTDKQVRTIPWATKITSLSDFQDTSWGWPLGMNVIKDRTTNIGAESSTNFSTNGITWHRQAVGSSRGSCQSLFEDGGFVSSNYNARNYNSVYFFGTYTNNSSFQNDTFTYPTDARSCFVRNVTGFACVTDLAGSYSNSGGDAQAYLEKLCFFYMHPDTRVRHTYQCTSKISGDVNMNSKLSNKDDHFFSYRLSSDDIQTVNNEKLLLMGIGMQFFHNSKATTHTTENRLKYFRVLISSGTVWNNPGTHTVLYCIHNDHLVSERDSPHSITPI